ncbi:hypothetical protein [Limnohabitans lacus]|uniref:HEPN domain-containing protein n=1 Tax=Limnohabitans lacus TaxID=3045173 RepID=A0ABT6XB19_9BURK|nr:hypothetical protein [Limnohabitans sp. HM2-2]MDI9235129.1 hypothetical protein [Limnohabitans sp. HM2-2]
MEQIERAKRYLKRIENIYEGIFSSSEHNKHDYDDDVISFFIHCYHIRDWIIQLNLKGITAEEIDSYINNHHDLKICADLANGSKHCKLTRTTRSGSKPHIAGKTRETSTWLTSSGGGEVMKCEYTILSNTQLIDALDLARECMRLWDLYVNNLKAMP